MTQRTEANASQPKITVLHLLDPAGGGAHLWGKERMVLWLMQAQKSAGVVEPHLATLSPSLLIEQAQRDGIESTALQSKSKFSSKQLAEIRSILARMPGAILHTHGYKANVLGRLAGRRKAKVGGIVSTCHGWVNNDWKLRIYNRIDRWSAFMSDAITVPDPNMLTKLGKSARAILNGIPDQPIPTEAERSAARARFGFRDGEFAAGMLGRLSPEKGIDEFLAAAQLSKDADVRWVVAGMGPLEEKVKSCGLANVRFVGYVDPAREYLAALDLYVQPSRTEGLSLSLLEAASARLPIVATQVGATDQVIRHQQEGVLIGPRDPQQLAEQVGRLAHDRQTADEFGAKARERFEQEFRMSVVEERYRALYREVLNKRAWQPMRQG